MAVGGMIDSSKSDVTTATFVNALIMFTISSVGMMLGNKVAVTALPLPCILVIIQVLGTLFLLFFCRKQLATPTKQVAKDWLPIAFLFTFMMYSSMKGFVYVNVATVLIFRNVGALATTCVEYFVRNIPVTAEIILSEFVIVTGAVIYGWNSAAFNWWGFFWIIVNVGAQVTYGVFLKKQMDANQHIKEMNKYTMSMYNNMLALPFIFLMMLGHNELGQLAEVLQELTMGGLTAILVTCVLGFMISTSGFALQQLVSATTFLVLNNLTKFLNIALGMIFLQDRLVGFMDWAGCIAAFGGGFWFSYASMRANAARSAGAAASANHTAVNRLARELSNAENGAAK
eukprot:GILI01030811.1.p1 GENE.GILI01030811.1~~GILI01030811.1.p1  ORF type:complete len:343 (+),score=57.34 GILI01030811.1:91-1119(+)